MYRRRPAIVVPDPAYDSSGRMAIIRLWGENEWGSFLAEAPAGAVDQDGPTPGQLELLHDLHVPASVARRLGPRVASAVITRRLEERRAYREGRAPTPLVNLLRGTAS